MDKRDRDRSVIKKILKYCEQVREEMRLILEAKDRGERA